LKVLISTNINKANNYLSPKINEQHKKESEKGPALGQAHIYGGVKLVNRIPIPPLIIGFFVI
jgi:hypothetical protein